MNSFPPLLTKISILSVFIIMAVASYYYFKTPGYDKTKLYQVECSDALANASIGDLLQCEGTHTDRRRLDFGRLVATTPEVAARVVMIRDRVRELEALSQQTANWALNWHLRFVAISVVLLAFVALFPLKETDQDKAQGTWTARFGRFAPSLTAIAVLLIAIGQSFAFHTKYKAGFTAAQQWQALAVIIDAELIDFMSQINTNALGDEDSARLSELIRAWADHLVEIQGNFAETYGSSFALISAP